MMPPTLVWEEKSQQGIEDSLPAMGWGITLACLFQEDIVVTWKEYIEAKSAFPFITGLLWVELLLNYPQ